MSLISRLFRPRADDHGAVRPLWHRTVEIARAPHWFAVGRIADTVPGRFDAITLVLCLVLLRLEANPSLAAPSVRLTELFVDDMDGQLRESGVGDLVVGKHIGRLMSVLGGRLGAYRDGLAGDDAALAEAISRNVSFAEDGTNPAHVAAEARALVQRLAALPDEAVLAGEIA